MPKTLLLCPVLCSLCPLLSPGVPRHAQSLAALQAYAHWLAQFYSEVHRQNPEQFISLVSTALEAITPLISSKVLPPWLPWGWGLHSAQLGWAGSWGCIPESWEVS